MKTIQIKGNKEQIENLQMEHSEEQALKLKV